MNRSSTLLTMEIGFCNTLNPLISKVLIGTLVLIQETFPKLRVEYLAEIALFLCYGECRGRFVVIG